MHQYYTQKSNILSNDDFYKVVMIVEVFEAYAEAEKKAMKAIIKVAIMAEVNKELKSAFLKEVLKLKIKMTSEKKSIVWCEVRHSVCNIVKNADWYKTLYSCIQLKKEDILYLKTQVSKAVMKAFMKAISLTTILEENKKE